ncbi:MAG TPA: glycosyltransferase family protein [Elusimicrobiales bacterium]|nr:glycosyltransferase family protein [Elusimicrobiales bacterium]
MKTLKNLCIIQARVGSTRLPGKVLMRIGGRTVLELVLARAKAARSVSEAAVVTGVGRENLPIVKLCSALGIRVFCGSEADVLDRFYQFAKLERPANIVRVTADCPLLDPRVIDRVTAAHSRSGADYTTNTMPPTFPDGEDVEVFTFQALEKAWRLSRLPSEREHVTPFIRKHGRMFRLCSVRNDRDLSGKRWTLDGPADMRFVSAVYRAFGGRKIFGMPEILRLLERRPDLEKINGGIARNEGYIKSLREDRLRGGRRP